MADYEIFISENGAFDYRSQARTANATTTFRLFLLCFAGTNQILIRQPNYYVAMYITYLGFELVFIMGFDGELYPRCDSVVQLSSTPTNYALLNTLMRKSGP